MKMTSTFRTFNLPKPANLTSAANRVRQKLRPAEPKDLSFEIETDLLGCDDFLIGDVRVDDERHIMFATSQQLDLLRQSKRWFLDGTFKVRRESFVQLFSIHAFIQKEDSMKQVSLVFVLMSRRRKADYVAVFTKLMEVIGTTQIEGCVLDFEAAAWCAIKEVFPGIDIKGCAFHWGQAVMRKVANLGLKTTYNQRKGIHNFIRKLLALPFLPATHIRSAFDQMVTMATLEPLQQLMTYLEVSWMRNSVWGVHQWSVFRQFVRTNNDVEDWHRRINGKAGRANLHFYLLVPLLRREANLATIQMNLVSEQSLTRFKRETYKRLQGLTTVLWDQYERREIGTSAFLKAIGGMYAPPTEQ